MKRRTYAKRRDNNELEIIEALRKAGATIMRHDDVDVIVGYDGRNYLLEIKTGKESRITPAQLRLRKTWKGQFRFVCTPLHALVSIGAVSANSLSDDEWNEIQLIEEYLSKKITKGIEAAKEAGVVYD